MMMRYYEGWNKHYKNDPGPDDDDAGDDGPYCIVYVDKDESEYWIEKYVAEPDDDDQIDALHAD